MSAVVSGNGSYSKNVQWKISSDTSTIDENGRLTISEDEEDSAIIVTAVHVEDPSITESMPIVVSSEEKPVRISSIKIAPKALTVGPGCFATLTALVEGEGNYLEDVTWSVSAASPNTYISKSGILFVAKDELPGTITVTAKSIIDESKTATLDVEVDSAIKSDLKKVLDVIVTPKSFSIYRSYNAIFSAKVVGINVFNQAVTWSVEKATSPFTKVKSTGSLTVASEEDSTSLIVKAASVEDPIVFGLAAVEVVEQDDSISPSPVDKYVVGIEVDSNKNLVVRFSDGSSQVAGRVSSGVYVPNITQEDRVLSFAYSEDPGCAPAPVDLSVDLSNYALKSETVIGKNVTAHTNIGGIPNGTSYAANSKLKAIVADMFEPLPEPVGDIEIYKGATDNPPTDRSGFEKIEGYSKEDLLATGLTVKIDVDETGPGQYPAIALEKRIALQRWSPKGYTFEYSFLTVDKGDYVIYYLTSPVFESLEYDFAFKEA